MVTVKFFNLIRSNHGVEQASVHAGKLSDIMKEIRVVFPEITMQELQDAVLFINKEKVMHLDRFSINIKDEDEVVFTNFVGGG